MVCRAARTRERACAAEKSDTAFQVTPLWRTTFLVTSLYRVAIRLKRCRRLPDTASFALRTTNHALAALGLLLTCPNALVFFLLYICHALGTCRTLPLSFVFGNSSYDVFPTMA